MENEESASECLLCASDGTVSAKVLIRETAPRHDSVSDQNLSKRAKDCVKLMRVTIAVPDDPESKESLLKTMRIMRRTTSPHAKRSIASVNHCWIMNRV